MRKRVWEHRNLHTYENANNFVYIRMLNGFAHCDAQHFRHTHTYTHTHIKIMGMKQSGSHQNENDMCTFRVECCYILCAFAFACKSFYFAASDFIKMNLPNFFFNHCAHTHTCIYAAVNTEMSINRALHSTWNVCFFFRCFHWHSFGSHSNRPVGCHHHHRQTHEIKNIFPFQFIRLARTHLHGCAVYMCGFNFIIVYIYSEWNGFYLI